MLKSVGKSLTRSKILTESQRNSSKIFINKKNSNFTVEKPGVHHLNQVTKVNITSNKLYQQYPLV